MPAAIVKNEGLLDSWGRRNRKIPNKPCAQCGKQFKPLRSSSKYCSRPCAWKNNGKNQKTVEESWWVDGRGYIQGKIWLPDGTQIRIRQHRFVMAGILGRTLYPWEDVHHIDGNKQNNDPNNLELISHGQHAKLSNLEREHAKGYKLNLSDEERKERSLRAIANGLYKHGQKAIQLSRAAIAKATGEEE